MHDHVVNVTLLSVLLYLVGGREGEGGNAMMINVRGNLGKLIKGMQKDKRTTQNPTLDIVGCGALH